MRILTLSRVKGMIFLQTSTRTKHIKNNMNAKSFTV